VGYREGFSVSASEGIGVSALVGYCVNESGSNDGNEVIPELAASLGFSDLREVVAWVDVNDGISVFELNGILDGLGKGGFDKPSDSGFRDGGGDGDCEDLPGRVVRNSVDGIGVGVTDGTNRSIGTLL
jgi:hypothetical protein